MSRRISFIAALALSLVSITTAYGQAPSVSKAQPVLDQAAAEQRYSFIVFYKTNDAATQAVAKTLNDGLAKRGDKGVAVYVNVTAASERSLVEKFKVARAPMPLTLAVAPNGAITGIFQQKLLDKHLDESVVTPGTAECMKHLQQGKIVLLSVHADDTTLPTGVQEFSADPEFKNRVSLVSLSISDTAESKFLSEMQIDPTKERTTSVIFMAPPGTVVGKYTSQVTKAKLAADLHAAGKCCSDPNCKHNKAK